MLRGALRRLAARFGGDGDDDASEDGRFVPSVLDASVRHAHGGGAEVDREVTDVEEQARRLEEERRKT